MERISCVRKRAVILTILTLTLLMSSCVGTQSSTRTPAADIESVPTITQASGSTVNLTRTQTTAVTAIPEATETPGDDLTERQRTILRALGAYEEIRSRDTNDEMRMIALNLIDALWPSANSSLDSPATVSLDNAAIVWQSRRSPSPGYVFEPSVFTEDSVYIEVGEGAQDDPILPSGALIFWIDGDGLNHPPSAEEARTHMLYLRDINGDLEREIVPVLGSDGKQKQDEAGKRILRVTYSRTNEKGEKQVLSPDNKWTTTVTDTNQVVLNADGTSNFQQEVIPAFQGDLGGNIYWQDGSEAVLLDPKPEGAENYKYVERTLLEDRKIVQLVDTNENGDVVTKYSWVTNPETKEGRWVESQAITREYFIEGAHIREDGTPAIIEFTADLSGGSILDNGEIIDLSGIDIQRNITIELHEIAANRPESDTYNLDLSDISLHSEYMNNLLGGTDAAERQILADFLRIDYAAWIVNGVEDESNIDEDKRLYDTREKRRRLSYEDYLEKASRKEITGEHEVMVKTQEGGDAPYEVAKVSPKQDITVVIGNPNIPDPFGPGWQGYATDENEFIFAITSGGVVKPHLEYALNNGGPEKFNYFSYYTYNTIIALQSLMANALSDQHRLSKPLDLDANSIKHALIERPVNLENYSTASGRLSERPLQVTVDL